MYTCYNPEKGYSMLDFSSSSFCLIMYHVSPTNAMNIHKKYHENVAHLHCVKIWDNNLLDFCGVNDVDQTSKI